jgi:uncharacterized iron-regulated membrane protein
MNNARRLWLQIHRWVGLSMGIVLVVVGLTGSFLAFYPEIDRQLNPDWLTSQPVGQPLRMQQVLDSAQAEMPERFLHSVFPAKYDTDVHHVWFTPSAQDQSAMWEVLVDPYTGQALGTRTAVPTMEFTQRNLVNTIYTLHFQLFMGDVGATLVGFSGLFLLISCLSGVVLWWPLNRTFKKGLLIKPGSQGIRLHYDIHRISGMYSVVLLAVLAATGIYLTFPNYLKPVIGLTSSLQQEPNFDFLPTSHLPTINADQALQLADAFAPGNRVKCLWLPGASGAAWRVSMVGERGVGWSGGPVEMWLHPEGGTVLSGKKYEQGSAGDSLVAWQLPLHSGRAFGTMGRVLIFIAGLIPLIMGITGTAIWMRKRKSSIHRKARIVRSKN